MFPSSRKSPSLLPGQEGLLSATPRRGAGLCCGLPLLTSSNGVCQRSAIGAALARQAGDGLAAAQAGRHPQLLHLRGAHWRLVRHGLPGAGEGGMAPAVACTHPQWFALWACTRTCTRTATTHRQLRRFAGSRSLRVSVSRTVSL